MGGLSKEKAAEAARIELQRAQVVMEKRPEEALGHLSEGRRLDPGNLEIALDLARVEARLARYSDAIDSLQRVLALDGSCEEALSLSCLCHLKMRRFDKAEEQANATLAVCGHNRLAGEILADCLRSRGEWHRAMDEIRRLLADCAGLDERPKARLNLKLAHCLLKIGSHAQAWEITRVLMQNGYTGAQVRIIHRESEAMNKAEISTAFGKAGVIQRLFLWMAGRHILRAFAIGQKRSLGFHGQLSVENLGSDKRGAHDGL